MKMKQLGRMMVLSLGLAGMARADEPPPPRHHHRPPAEAFSACAEAKEGDACTVHFKEKEVQGKCRPIPAHIQEDAGKLVCFPPHPHHAE